MSSPSDAEVIGRSTGEPEAFGLIYDRHAGTLLRFLGRRVGAEVAEALIGELFRVAFERRKAFDASRASALPWLYGIGAKLLLKHRRGEARRLRASARIPRDRDLHGAAGDTRLLRSPGSTRGLRIDAWGLPSVLYALGNLFSIAFVFLLRPLAVREMPPSRAHAPRG